MNAVNHLINLTKAMCRRSELVFDGSLCLQ